MASAKMRAALAEEGEGLKMDMSPMIDLVFLLLIFFMVNSTLIVVRIDKKVKIPVASEAQVAKDATGRIVVNIRENGEYYDLNRERLADEDAITEYVRERKAMHDLSGLKSRIHVRADKNVAVKEIKRAVQAAGAAGVIEVIFSSYVTEK